MWEDLLNFWLFGGTSLKDIAYHAIQVLHGKHMDAPGIFHFYANQATFYAKGRLAIQFDGEPITKMSPLEFDILEKALKVLVSEGENQALFTTKEENS
jgi:diacylglycerol kinase family enzyme